MNTTKTFTLAALLATAAFSCANAQTTFTNSSLIQLPAASTDTGPASPYPSLITVSGLVGSISNVTVTLNGLTHTFADDIDILLVSPTGAKVVLMSDTGGAFGVGAVNLTFSDAAASLLPDETQITSGTFRPSDYDFGGAADVFPAPAPGGPYDLLLSAFNGANPNGTWSLYAFDDSIADVGVIAGGYSITITTTQGGTLPGVPDGGSSLALAGLGFAALIALRRRLA